MEGNIIILQQIEDCRDRNDMVLQITIDPTNLVNKSSQPSTNELKHYFDEDNLIKLFSMTSFNKEIVFSAINANNVVFIKVISSFKRKQWNIFTSNAYLDIYTNCIVKTFYLEKITQIRNQPLPQQQQQPSPQQINQQNVQYQNNGQQSMPQSQQQGQTRRPSLTSTQPQQQQQQFSQQQYPQQQQQYQQQQLYQQQPSQNQNGMNAPNHQQSQMSRPHSIQQQNSLQNINQNNQFQSPPAANSQQQTNPNIQQQSNLNMPQSNFTRPKQAEAQSLPVQSQHPQQNQSTLQQPAPGRQPSGTFQSNGASINRKF